VFSFFLLFSQPDKLVVATGQVNCRLIIYRIVEVAWSIGGTNPPPSLKADLVFDYTEVLSYMGGDVMKLEELPTFTNRWDSELSAFQAHVQSSLSAI
jgi:hypothetical protein